MLLELLIENYAVVEKLAVRFHPGLNVLTGETGSGKSIVVDALGLLFGGRASAEMLRTGAARARVSGVFELPAEARPLLDQAGIAVEGDDLIVDREILGSGKSRAWISSWPVPAALLRDLAPYLGDIHGQHDQQRLFSHEAQLALLDSFAGSASQADALGEIYRAWRACEAELKELDRAEQERLRLLDLWRFQRNEIDGANLKPGEDEELEAERRVLQNVGRISEGAVTAYSVLYDAPESAYAAVRTAGKRLEELRRFDDNLGRLADLLKPAEIAIDEAAGELRDYVARLEADPDRLEEVESRLAAIDKLKRKYGTSVGEILAFRAEAHAQIEATENASEHRAAVERRQKELAAEYEGQARKLSARRAKAAGELGRKVETEVRSLAMDRAVFQVQLTPGPWSATGIDNVQFLVSANTGEAPRPIDKVASGGELSRIALSVKTCVTSRDARRTLVFDEVDAGIGGTAADSVGRRLKALAANDQVLCVTHLAQIAGYADHHYAVEKFEVKGRTAAGVQELEGEARTREISRMLSGRVTPEALKHAEQLLRSGTSV
ncbi:MAG TPA: DNA repair protein RecN [Bryobacteraceae bacterium]|nr:DNA repair protein RecN [Bryobacteraceae bacterium]